MVTAVRRGKSLRAVARLFGVGKSTVERWVKRAAGRRLDRVDFRDRCSCPTRSRRTDAAMEALILDVRCELKERSALGEHGAGAIRRELMARHVDAVPAARTIGRVLGRRGVLDGRCRVRRPAPPKGWYLPDVAEGTADIDCVDLIEDRRIEGGPLVDVLTALSLFGRLGEAWPAEAHRTARDTLTCLLTHWRTEGCPAYAQFDNDTRFQGPHQHRDVLSRVMRLCLSLRVTPVFTPPRETGFQASIENFNGRWQRAVWDRFHHVSVAALQERSQRYIEAFRCRYAHHAEAAPPRRPVPKRYRLNLAHPTSGRIIYLRRTTADGRVSLLGHTFAVDRHWPYRLVRCEVDLATDRISFFALRRRDPTWQPLLREVDHALPQRNLKM